MVDQCTEGHAIIPRGGEVCNLNSLQEEDTNMNNWVNIKNKIKTQTLFGSEIVS